jgi:hypothetical protein
MFGWETHIECRGDKIMANKLNNVGYSNGMTAKQILSSRGKVLASGFMDEIDAEAERAANAINRSSFFRPHRPRKQPVTLNRLKEMDYATA